jgi:hypothetical protein
MVESPCLRVCACCPHQPSQACGHRLASLTSGSFLRAGALGCSYIWCERVSTRKAEMGERHYHSGVCLPWNLEPTSNTPFIAQVPYLFNLHTPLGRDVDPTGA